MEEKNMMESEEKTLEQQAVFKDETKIANTKNKKRNRIVSIIVSSVLLILLGLAYPTYSWFSKSKYEIASYAPISSPESLYVGAGHTDLDNGTFESVRYLYFYGIDTVTTENDYNDYVFCVYGKGISEFKIQLAYTTNNDFTYELYHAEESQNPEGNGWISYVTHDEIPKTYYYRIDSEDPSAISGAILNQDTTFSETYGEYENVNTYANPKYWQSSSSEQGNRRGNFVNYYVLRIRAEDNENNRETDVICISVKAVTAG